MTGAASAARPTPGLRLGIDVGGTFTDFVAYDEAGNATHFHKTPTTPDDPARGLAAGLGELLDRLALDGRSVAEVGHGTTIALNMLLEARAPSIGLITTHGFRDVLEIARQTRPHLYDYRVTRPAPLARRAHRHEVAERLAADGTVLTPLDEAAVAAAAAALKAAGVPAVAIVFLHSYRNAAHERRAGEIVAQVYPDAFTCLSSEVLPAFREFERSSTAAANAYVGPTVAAYLDRLVARLVALGINREPRIFHSNGGVLPLADARRFPVRTCLSGPAAGVVAAAAVARAAGEDDAIAFDVGGTSTDVSLVSGGRPTVSGERAVAGHAIGIAAVDVHAIGAGGGSIAWIDDGGALRVGPESAGADPGPVAYGRGGTRATLTDANVVLGRLSGEALLGGRMKIDAPAAAAAIDRQIARPLGLSLEAAAFGMLRVAAAGIARAIRAVAAARGLDPAALPLIAYGGAGPLLADLVDAEIGCPRVIVPPEPGTLCARGILLSDLSFDFVRSVLARADEDGWRLAAAAFGALAADATAWLAREGVPMGDHSLRLVADARYVGQSFEVGTEIEDTTDTGCSAFHAAFAAAHEALYGRVVPGRAIEIVSCRVTAVGRRPKPAFAAPASAPVDLPGTARRRTYFGSAAGWQDVVVIERSALPAGTRLKGPAIVEEMSSTTVVPPGYVVRIDDAGNLVMAASASRADRREAQP